MTRMNINDFMSNFRGGGARPNRFYVDVVFPNVPAIATVAGIDTPQSPLRFACKAASIPGSTLGNVDVPYMGRQFKVPGDRTFAEYSITILNDVDFKIRYAFEAWMSAINTHVGNVHLPTGGKLDMRDLMANFSITQLGRNDEILARYALVDAYPTDIAAIDLDWGNNDSVEEFTVTLQYQYWQSVPTVAIDLPDSAGAESLVNLL